MYVTIPNDFAEKSCAVALHSTGPLTAQTRLKTGTYLFYEGDEVDWLYQVNSGVLRLTRLLVDGRRQVIAFGYPGDIVGFPADGLHHTDCDALSDVRLQPIRSACLVNGQLTHLNGGYSRGHLHTGIRVLWRLQGSGKRCWEGC